MVDAGDLADHDSRGLAADLGPFADTLSWYFRVIELHLSRDLDRALGGLDVVRGKGRISVLLLTDEHPGIRASAIAGITMLDRAVIARIVAGFEAARLMRRAVCAVDRRAVELTLTDAGTEVAAGVRRVIGRQSAAFFAFLSPQDRAALLGILRRTYGHLRAGAR